MKTPQFLSFTLMALVLATSMNCALAAGEDEYDKGVKDYKNRNYTEAAQHFWKSINQGNVSPHPWLYMAHSYAAAGDKAKALESYQQVEKIFTGQPAAKMASAGIRKLGRIPSNNSQSSTSATPTVNHVRPRTNNPDAWRSLPFKDRMITYPPIRSLDILLLLEVLRLKLVLLCVACQAIFTSCWSKVAPPLLWLLIS